MVKEDGDAIKKTQQISMKENTKMTKRTGMGFSLGQVAMSIKELIKTMKERGLVR